MKRATSLEKSMQKILQKHCLDEYIVEKDGGRYALKLRS